MGVGAVGDLVASAATGPAPGAVRGIEAVAWQLTEQQVAVLLVASDISQDDGPDYRLGSSPTQFGAGDQGAGIPVPLEDGLVWAALHQDAIVVQLPDRSGPLAGHRRRRCCVAEPLPEAGGQGLRSRAGQTRVPARVFTGSMDRPGARSWMTPATHHPGGQHVGPHPRTAGGPP